MRILIRTCWEKIVAIVQSIFSIDKKAGYLARKLISILANENPKYGINHLSQFIDLPIAALRIWLDKIPEEYGYNKFTIPKKSGRGRREICSPNQALKDLQRRIYHKLLKQLNYHQAATTSTFLWYCKFIIAILLRYFIQPYS